VNVNASGANGKVDKVELYVDGKLNATDDTSPYGFDLFNLKTKHYSIEARACDDDGAASSDFINISVQIPDGIPWIEDFSTQDTGAKSDEPPTYWTASCTGGTFAVTDNDCLEMNASSASAGVFESNNIDISSAIVNVSLEVKSRGGLEANGRGLDWVKAFKIVDGGSPALLTKGYVSGNTPSKIILSEDNITGSRLKLRIETRVTQSDEFYFIDNINIVPSGPAKP
jgi:hypothetical protein